MKRFFWLWGPVVAYTGLIFWFSSAPRVVPGMQYFPWMDKPFHVAEYLPLGCLLARALGHSLSGLSARSMVITVMIAAVAVAVSDELYQSSIVTRVSSVWDVCADVTGVFIGQALYRFLTRRIH